jgi:type I restriction enzyme, S subunit
VTVRPLLEEDQQKRDSVAANSSAIIISQKEIVAQLEFLREETQHLESIYQQKLAALDELKKSLLDQAFTGQL